MHVELRMMNIQRSIFGVESSLFLMLCSGVRDIANVLFVSTNFVFFI